MQYHLAGLTTLFGMGRGEPRLLSIEVIIAFRQYCNVVYGFVNTNYIVS
jgi:hypothetical protein